MKELTKRGILVVGMVALVIAAYESEDAAFYTFESASLTNDQANVARLDSGDQENRAEVPDEKEKIEPERSPAQVAPTEKSSPVRRGPMRNRLFRKQTLYASFPAPLNSSGNVDVGGVLTASVGLLSKEGRAHLAASDFTPVQMEAVESNIIGNQKYLNYDQTVGGLPIEGAGLNVMVKDVAGQPRVVFTDSRTAQVPQMDTSELISESQAIELARSALGGTTAEVWANRKVIRNLDGEWQPVRDLEFEGEANAVSVHLQSGKTWIEDRKHAAATTRSITGVASGKGVLFDPSEKGSGVRQLPLPYLTVLSSDGKSATTTAKGGFQLTSSNAKPKLQATLKGPYVQVVPKSGTALVAIVSANPAQNNALLFQGGSDLEGSVAQINAFYHVNLVRAFLANNGLKSPSLSKSIKANVNIAEDSCNAYYVASTLNFFRSGDGCLNSSYDTVIVHEYGHFVDDIYGGIRDGGLSEGWGDVLAALVSGQPLVGEGLLPGGKDIRTVDNNYQFPDRPEWEEVHKLGQAWAGFVWHLKGELQKSLPQEQADSLVRALVLPSLVSNSFDIPSAVRETLVRDDDNGNLSDGTPHLTAILSAAGRHNLKKFLVASPNPTNKIIRQIAARGK